MYVCLYEIHTYLFLFLFSRHDIAKILLKVALNTKNQIKYFYNKKDVCMNKCVQLIKPIYIYVFCLPIGTSDNLIDFMFLV